MLESKRKFGIEIEFLCRSSDVLDNLAKKDIRCVSDGSLRPHTGGEYVSPPMSGEDGEYEIARVCHELKKQGVDVEHPATSLHLHLDGEKRNREVIVDRKKIKKNGYQVAISRALLNDKSIESISTRLMQTKTVPFVCNVTVFDGVKYYSKAKLTREPRMNYVYFLIEEPDRIPWLTRMFYFYTQYDDVMSSLVSHSRSIGNMYCQRLGESFSLKEIEGIKCEDDFIDVWYKGMGIGGHYCDSRYHNVNFHSYFDRHGTVEIRSHGATTDPNKVLMWVKLHQYIADKLEKCDLCDIKIDTTDKDNVYLEFIKFLEDEPVLVEYTKRLLGYFSGISIVKDKVKRK